MPSAPAKSTTSRASSALLMRTSGLSVAPNPLVSGANTA